ncbi:NADH-quinone oxidoreductase subunit N [bacterium]|nr:MAG: NADH-quinone oxidoreductase subunit N [bacterium]
MLISGLFILLLVSAISAERINGIIINRAAALVLLYSFILSISTLNVSIIGSGIGVYGGLYQVTVVSKIVECFIYLLGAMILSNTMLIMSSPSKEQNTLLKIGQSDERSYTSSIKLKSEYSIIALFTVVGGVLLITSNDLVSMYLSIELQSFGLYVLATIYRDSQAATYAGLKYFLLGGLSSGFILLGSSIIYAYTGVTNLESIYLLISQATGSLSSDINFESNSGTILSLLSFKFVEIGLLVMTVGFLFKVASAPFHNWAPDVYDGVPTKVTTWLAIMAKISILTFLLDLVIGSMGQGPLENNFTSSSLANLMLIAALLSLLVGTIVGLAQSRIKRLLAYSTISHVGFLLLAIAIATEDSIESFIFYLIQYSLTSANAFFILIAFGSLSLSLSGNANEEEHNSEAEYSPVQFISQLRGQFNAKGASPLLALAMAIVLFSMAGIPPLIGFFAKQAVLLSAVKNGFIFLALVGIITSVISAAYYLRVIKVMVFDPFETELSSNLSSHNNNVSTEQSEMSNSLSFSISILTVLILFFVLKPSLILNSAHIMALSLFYL